MAPANLGARPRRQGWRDAGAGLLHRLALPASLAIGLAAPPLAIRAEPLPSEAATFIEEKVRNARVMGNARKALAFCRAAQEKAAQYDRDAFYQGLITACIAGAEVNLLQQHRTLACRYLQQAQAALREVSADHPDYDILKHDVEAVQLGIAQLGCRAGNNQASSP